jgi:broad specificity phosphatase PhoE
MASAAHPKTTTHWSWVPGRDSTPVHAPPAAIAKQPRAAPGATENMFAADTPAAKNAAATNSKQFKPFKTTSIRSRAKQTAAKLLRERCQALRIADDVQTAHLFHSILQQLRTSAAWPHANNRHAPARHAWQHANPKQDPPRAQGDAYVPLTCCRQNAWQDSAGSKDKKGATRTCDEKAAQQATPGAGRLRREGPDRPAN